MPAKDQKLLEIKKKRAYARTPVPVDKLETVSSPQEFQKSRQALDSDSDGNGQQ